MIIAFFSATAIDSRLPEVVIFTSHEKLPVDPLFAQLLQWEFHSGWCASARGAACFSSWLSRFVYSVFSRWLPTPWGTPSSKNDDSQSTVSSFNSWWLGVFQRKLSKWPLYLAKETNEPWRLFCVRWMKLSRIARETAWLFPNSRIYKIYNCYRTLLWLSFLISCVSK